MHYYLTALSIVVGICLAFGILYLFIGLRRKDDKLTNLTFALFTLSYAGAVLTSIANYGATSVSDWLSSARWDGVFIISTWLLLILYVATYTKIRPKLFLWPLAAVFVATGIAHGIRPNLIHGEIYDLAFVILPWGEALAYVEATDSIWATVFLLANLATIVYVMVACALQFRRGERRSALILGAGMAWFIFTAIVDLLVDAGIAPLYLGDFGFLGLAVVMSLEMANRSIRTEEELALYRGQMESLVNERTTELEVTNQQLESEITDRKLVQETLHQRVEELAVLGQITHMLATVTDLTPALKQACEAITHLFGAASTYIVLPPDNTQPLQALVGYEGKSGATEATSLPVSLRETPYFRQVLKNAETLIIPDAQVLPVAAPMQDFISRQQLQGIMLVPLVVRGSAIGLLTIASEQGQPAYTQEQAWLAETIAGDVAGAIENARLFERAQATGAEEERSRLARDLHDAVTQTIYAATLIAESLPQVWARNPEEGQRNLVKLRQLVRGGLAEMRTLLFELRPQALEAAGLSTLLHYLSDALTARTRIPVQVSAEETGSGEPGLPPEAKVALYRIAQEALNNTAKHSSATQASVVLDRKPEQVTLTIQDNGRGFNPAAVPSERMGLSIMAERAEAIGAEFVVESAPGQGVRVVVVWRVEG